MGKSNKKLLEIIMEIFRELYEHAIPKANFDELVENASITEDGKKYIPFDDYEIDEDVMRNIVNYHIKKNRLTKQDQNVIKFEVYLGPSPKMKIKNKDKKDE